MPDRNLLLTEEGEIEAQQQKLFVQPNDPGMVAPGLWVQTGLGVAGEDFTFWIEDGS